MTTEDLTKEVQKSKEENASLKLLLEALNTKVAQLQIQLHAVSVKVGVNTSYVFANLIADDYSEEKANEEEESYSIC